MLLLILVSFAPSFTLQTELLLNYNKFNPIATVPSASAAYTTASSGLPTTTTTTYAQQQVQWPPTAVHNDWFVIQAAANTAFAAAASTQVDATRANKLQKRHKAMMQDKQPHSTPPNSYGAPHATQQRQQQQNLANYYTYNSTNSGNYRSPAPDMHLIAPYVLTISNQRRLSMASSERSRRRAHSNCTTQGAVNNLNNRGYVNSYNNSHINKSVRQHNKYANNEPTVPNKVNNTEVIPTQPQHPVGFGWQDTKSKTVRAVNVIGNGARNDADVDESTEVGSLEKDINSLEEAQFNEVLVPLENTLNKVRNFCEIFRRIISDDEAEFASSDLVTLGKIANKATAVVAQSATLDTVIPDGDNTQLPLEVQGQRSPPTATSTTAAHLFTKQSQPIATAALVWPTVTVPALSRSTSVTASARATTLTNASANAKNSAKSLTSTALAIGRGKKLKKKLKKLMFPLLLAYKLKFIALVPLLIGGLTLLVGSTGLAGFFFALFLTVISLKGGGSVNKSVVIRKVW